MRMSWTYCFLHGNMTGTQLLGPVNPITAVDRNMFKKKSQAGVNENITVSFKILGATSLFFTVPATYHTPSGVCLLNDVSHGAAAP